MPVGHGAHKHQERHQNISTTIIRSTSTSTTPSSSSDFPSTTASILSEDPNIVVASHLVPTSSTSSCQPNYGEDASHHAPKPPTIPASLSQSAFTLSSANSFTELLPLPLLQCSEQSDEHHPSFRLSNLKRPWGMKKAKYSQCISIPQPRPSSIPPPLPQNKAFLPLKISKPLRKVPSAPVRKSRLFCSFRKF